MSGALQFVPQAKFNIGTRVKIVRDGKEFLGKIDEVVLFRRDNTIGYRIVDQKNWCWYYVTQKELDSHDILSA